MRDVWRRRAQLKCSVLGLLALGLLPVEAGATGEVRDQQLLERVEKEYGRRARHRVETWQQLMEDVGARVELAELEKVRSANNFFNRLSWVSDEEHWGQEDYWATPVEMLATNGGDCEDFSIGKYFTLSDEGLMLDKLRITYVKALEYDQAHMVLAYYPSPDAEPWILDNINKTLLPASQRPDLLPVYSFNGLGLWLARDRHRQISSDAGQSLPQWGDLNRRLGEELGAGQP
ncbi:transglutaminase-like cysteine peptidase [Pseudomaricurvus sp. HS19]|uniref:transglutaminase-like cysteine peptidase n=1 Tax=Pseudomaricurvus sp. HS19 TaxID=2692626 RepID=UPI00136A7D2E|nr:transglutaminase-like cysteine peptidase [Pseudomaricurvus sp. HS19]MYM62759.1 sulfate adenylyltransferase [Pseudomaricurvus sp. HS19]